ncbi:MAG: hypothetical protein IPP74_07345 [Alphaproteobacteria bacterium]|nr:hypothetical protein [Alphaproteobacteria bacterium]
MITVSILKWLINFYKIHKDIEISSQNLISIDTLDNPGWGINIDVKGTCLEAVILKESDINNSDDNWYVYKIRNSIYDAVGDPLKLEFLLLRFMEIFQKYNSNLKEEGTSPDKNINWLMSWYASHCNGNWEHMYGVTINTIDNPGWRVRIDLAETKLENLSIDRQTYETSETDWYTFIIKDKKFDAAGDPSKLEILIESFRVIVKKELINL